MQALRRWWGREWTCRLTTSQVLVSFLLVLLAVFTFFWRLGEGSLFDYDEGIHAQMAQEMLWRHDLLTPYLAGEPHFTKPPLYLWLTVVAFKVFGINEFAARFWAALAGVGTIFLTYLCGRDLYNQAVGVGAALLLLIVNNLPFSYYYNFVSIGRMAMMTTSLAFYGLLTMWLAWRGEKDRYCLISLGLPLGLAAMTKNVAGLMPLAALGLYWLCTRPLRDWRWKELGLAAILLAALALPWHISQAVAHRGFLQSYIVENILSRAFSNLEAGYRSRPAWFYLQVIWQGFSYVAFILPIAVLDAVCRALFRRDRASLLLLLWAMVCLGIYTLSETKLPWYILEAYPALALLTASFLVRLGGERWAPVLILAFMVVFGWRLPSARNGSPDVKRVASVVRQVANEDDVVSLYMQSREAPRPTSLFYAGRPVRAVLATAGGLDRAREGAAFLLTDLETWQAAGLQGQVLCRSGTQLLVCLRNPNGEEDNCD